jgi:hypothetical protein
MRPEAQFIRRSTRLGDVGSPANWSGAQRTTSGLYVPKTAGFGTSAATLAFVVGLALGYMWGAL